MSTTSSTPMPTHGSFQLIEAVVERLDGAPVGERRCWSDNFKAQAVAAAMAPDVNVSTLAGDWGFRPHSCLVGAGLYSRPKMRQRRRITCKMNDVDPIAWLTLTLERIANQWPNAELDALMPCNYNA